MTLHGQYEIPSEIRINIPETFYYDQYHESESVRVYTWRNDKTGQSIQIGSPTNCYPVDEIESILKLDFRSCENVFYTNGDQYAYLLNNKNVPTAHSICFNDNGDLILGGQVRSFICSGKYRQQGFLFTFNTNIDSRLIEENVTGEERWINAIEHSFQLFKEFTRGYCITGNC